MNRKQVSIVLLAGCLSMLSGCTDSDGSYFPLGQGTVLSYDIVETRSGENYRRKTIAQYAGPFSVTLADEQQPVYRWLTAAGPRGLLQAREDGIYLIAGKDQNRQPVLFDSETLLLPQPLMTDSQWETTVTTELLEWRKHTLEAADRNPAYRVPIHFKCEQIDAVLRTPAGTFTNVAVIKGSGERRIEIGGTRDLSTIHVAITEWYAPGVGLIQRERVETTDNQHLNPGTSKMILERIN